MRLRLIKIAVLWFFSASIIAYWLNAGEGQVAREINNKISSIISDQLTDLHFFLDQSMHDNGSDLQQSFNPNYPTYGYRDGDLVFWNSNAYFPEYERIKTVDTVAFFSDENIRCYLPQSFETGSFRRPARTVLHYTHCFNLCF